MAADACATNRVADPPPPVDLAIADVFFSGIVNGPDFCANRSLGGPRTYAFDGDGDGVADVCSLPYTRREAVARQNALETFDTPKATFDNALALACRELASTDFGDSPPCPRRRCLRLGSPNRRLSARLVAFASLRLLEDCLGVFETCP